MPVLAERGYLIPAIDTEETNYVACANRLADSIRQWHPDANITILTRDMLPYGDQGGWANDWQMFAASPYRQTIKLEADMIAASPVDHWWTLFEKRDVVISQGARTFYNEPAESRFYRKFFDANNLPDVYNAVTYWRLSKTAQEFFAVVKNIFENWDQWKNQFKYSEPTPSTDAVYAIAAMTMGVENVTLPPGYGPQIVHMKKHVQPIQSQDWTQELTWEHLNPGLRIHTVTQFGFVHYHVKDWL